MVEPINHNTIKPIKERKEKMSKQLADNQDLLAMTHVGEDPEKYMKSVTPPIFMNSLHVFDTVKDYFDVDIFEDEFIMEEHLIQLLQFSKRKLLH